MTPDVERQILEYLREGEGDRRERLERERLRDVAIARVANEQSLTNQKLDSMAALWNERHSGLAARLDRLEGDVEDTGNFHVAELQRELEQKQAEIATAAAARRDSGVWWKRTSIGWFVAGVGGLFALTIAAFLGAIAMRIIVGK